MKSDSMQIGKFCSLVLLVAAFALTSSTACAYTTIGSLIVGDTTDHLVDDTVMFAKTDDPLAYYWTPGSTFDVSDNDPFDTDDTTLRRLNNNSLAIVYRAEAGRVFTNVDFVVMFRGGYGTGAGESNVTFYYKTVVDGSALSDTGLTTIGPAGQNALIAYDGTWNMVHHWRDLGAIQPNEVWLVLSNGSADDTPSISSVYLTTALVPEPASIVLLLTGGIAVLSRGRRHFA